MDTTEQYIKMADCPEIQGRWEPRVGDWTNKGMVSNVIGPLVCLLRIHTRRFYKHELIWYPRQDQLQEMAHVCECSDPVCLLIDFHKFVDRESNPDIEHSWEQLWLAFTMHELHGKKWAGEKWEIVKEGA